LIRRSSAARITDGQRGYVLISAIALAILYFALMELMLIDSQRTLRAADRFREKIVATVLAENAAELSAENMGANTVSTADYDNGQGHMHAKMTRESPATAGAPSKFVIVAKGDATGVPPVSATVTLKGTLTGSQVEISESYHSQ
jgi:hypothetical protein